MVKYNGKKIIYTFKYGAYLTIKDKFIYLISTVLFFLVFGITLFIVCYYRDSDTVTYKALTVSCIAGIIYLGVTIYCWCKARRTDRDISKWLTDEYLFEACAAAYQFEESWWRGSCSYELGINFENNGEKYSRFTSRTEKGRYFRRLSKIVKSGEINILYSPKYGEVMIFENERVNK